MPDYDDTDPFLEPATKPQSGPGLMTEWNDALNDPTVRASLLSAGLALMQPPGFGQTGAGQLAQVVGAAGETVGQREKMDEASRGLDIKQQEADSRQTQRATAADNASTRLFIQRKDVESKIEARKAAAETAKSRMDMWAARAELLRVQAAAAPGNMEVQNALREAQTEKARADADWVRTRAELAPEETDIRRRGADARTLNAETGAKRADDPTTRRLRQQAEYRKGVSAYNEYLKTLLPSQPKPPIADWLRQQGLPSSPNDVGVTAPAEATPAPVATTPAPAAAPAPGGIDIARETQQAKANIAKNPAAADRIKALYKQRTGKDLE